MLERLSMGGFGRTYSWEGAGEGAHQSEDRDEELHLGQW